MKTGVLLVAGVIGMVFSPAMATTPEVHLSVDVHMSAHTWDAYATVLGDCNGLASWSLTVEGTNGLTVTSSQNMGPYYTTADGVAGYNPNDTPASMYSNGTNGYDIHARQKYTVYGDTNDPALDALVIQNLGQLPGSAGGISWNAPVLLASGTYSGELGYIWARTGPGFFNLLEQVDGGPWVGPGNVTTSDLVIYDGSSVYVLEPLTLTLLGIGSTLIIARRRRR